MGGGALNKETTKKAPLTLRVYAAAMMLLGALLFPAALAFAALGYYVEGLGVSSAYEIATAVAAILGMGVGALKWAQALSAGRRVAALGVCVVAAPACGIPAWIHFGSGDARLGWVWVLAGAGIALPLLASCIRHWNALEGGGEIYPDRPPRRGAPDA